MALTLDSTPMAATANTYALLVEAEDYALTVPIKDAWLSADNATKNAALVQATRMLDTMNWQGYRKTVAQPLQWPRSFVVDREGWGVNPLTVPAKVRDACCEFAVRLVADDRADDAGGLSYGKTKVGSIEVEGARRQPIPASVLEMVREFMAFGGQTRLVRG